MRKRLVPDVRRLMLIRFLCGGMFSLSLLSASTSVHATRSANMDILRADLHSGDVSLAARAARELGAMTGPEAFSTLQAALQLGAPTELLTVLIEALGAQGDPAALPLLRHFAMFRDPAVRVAALRSLETFAGDEVAAVLINRLGDRSAAVRAVAAAQLAQRGERAAEARLFQLLLRGDDVAVALGRLAGPETAINLGERIGQVSDDRLAAAFGEMLLRADFGPDPLRVEVVQLLGKLSGTEATAALIGYLAAIPAYEARPSRTVAETILGESR